jgi:hypothetical protein
MNKLLIILLLCTGCSGTSMFLRYSYNRALENLPPCSKVHAINNDHITYSMVEDSTNSVYVINTNYYKAYYTTDGSIYKTVKTNAK